MVYFCKGWRLGAGSAIADPEISLANITQYSLFDRFIHYLLDREIKKRGRDSRFTLEVRRAFNSSLALWLLANGGASTVSISSIPAELCREACKHIVHEYDENTLRRELTAGCLIEKTANNTIFFNHRSLQEFLAAEELINTVALPDATTKSSTLNPALRVINAEVADFIIEAARESGDRKERIVQWFRLLAGLDCADMPTSLMQLFVDLSLIPEVGMPEKRIGKWHDWLSYFIRNSSASFSAGSQDARKYLLELIRNGLRDDSSREVQASALLLMTNIAIWSSDVDRDFPSIMAMWLNPDKLITAINAARQCKKNEHYYVRDEEYAFWLLLQVSDVEMSKNLQVININLIKLRSLLMKTVRMGLDGYDVPVREMIQMPVQKVFAAWNRNNTTKLRQYFTDTSLRAKILPLEVTFIPSEYADDAAGLSTKPVLKLSKRVG